MAFEVFLGSQAKKELLRAIKYYGEINSILGERFYNEFVELNSLLKTNPYFIIKYKYIRTYKIKSFPYVVHFVVDEEKNEVAIIAIVFGKRQKTDFGDRLPGIQ